MRSSRPRLTEVLAAKAPSVVTATFVQPDLAYDWILSFLASLKAWKDMRDIHVSAHRSYSTQWGLEDNPHADQVKPTTYIPASGFPQLLKWNDYWLQITRYAGQRHWKTGREEGGMIVIVLHHWDRKVLDELIEAARNHESKGARTHVTIHLPSQWCEWTQAIQKTRRSMDSLVLPSGVQEKLLSDAREFLTSEKWYRDAGVPYRRGYLLHGVPGSGKTSTIHALASELCLPIYSISLAMKGLDDGGLQALVAETPPDCILTLEDIDCAFPDRKRSGRAELQQDERPPASGSSEGDQAPNTGADAAVATIPGAAPRPRGDPNITASSVTLSGLLNVIDGVWSEEGRIIIATTNHIENLDPALIRPGRLDVRVEYKACTRDQAERMFTRFFPKVDEERLKEMALQFATTLPDGMFSAAALQGYLLNWKNNPLGAIENAAEFVKQNTPARVRVPKATTEVSEVVTPALNSDSDTKAGVATDSEVETKAETCLPVEHPTVPARVKDADAAHTPVEVAQLAPKVEGDAHEQETDEKTAS
ncbi:P-loop containing nucleoside triphosphate hydrolase protein [Exidia glandulosa HHB12029]|uniref:p-loop containing nucleoside triphosphate hydrolase protein n=1 Tax=Exidia glandulosa HHB12029 TaxID=1314781 RepID=A0A165FCK0_EXIGL|nr:P-loop containing nucleoside triphosphate hydrolase protein [Exidia glandulosa HHB12029]